MPDAVQIYINGKSVYKGKKVIVGSATLTGPNGALGTFPGGRMDISFYEVSDGDNLYDPPVVEVPVEEIRELTEEEQILHDEVAANTPVIIEEPAVEEVSVTEPTVSALSSENTTPLTELETPETPETTSTEPVVEEGANASE